MHIQSQSQIRTAQRTTRADTPPRLSRPSPGLFARLVSSVFKVACVSIALQEVGRFVQGSTLSQESTHCGTNTLKLGNVVAFTSFVPESTHCHEFKLFDFFAVRAPTSIERQIICEDYHTQFEENHLHQPEIAHTVDVHVQGNCTTIRMTQTQAGEALFVASKLLKIEQRLQAKLTKLVKLRENIAAYHSQLKRIYELSKVFVPSPQGLKETAALEKRLENSQKRERKLSSEMQDLQAKREQLTQASILAQNSGAPADNPKEEL